MWDYAAELVHVHDGDTLRVDLDLGFGCWRRDLDVRLLGLDCPELGRADKLGEQARDYVIAWSDRAAPLRVRTKQGNPADKYGRYLAVVSGADGATLNDALLAAGLAKLYSGHGVRPTWP